MDVTHNLNGLRGICVISDCTSMLLQYIKIIITDMYKE